MALTRKIAIDLGTTNTLMYVPGKGIVLNEPSVVAVSQHDNAVLAIGSEAFAMIGRTPESIIAHRPLKDGVIADYRVTEAMLRYLLKKTGASVRFLRPEVLVSVPAGITSTERRAVVDATISAGAKAAYLIKEPVAAAIGASIPIGESSGHMIVDIGGGTTEVAVISLGGIVTAHSARVGGNVFDHAIAEHIKKRYGIVIGEPTAEEIKKQIGSAIVEESSVPMSVRGRDLASGLPRETVISSHEVTEALRDPLLEVLQAIKYVLQETPPELASDIIDKGIVVSGGGALLKNIDRLISGATQVPCYIADDPLVCVVKGTGAALENLDAYKRSILLTK
ncbi:MAG: rod shape-determining protein [Candidatus Andersenbacteria bacterium RIFCSPHIGHO2_01_FULL_46_36]|uniref:Cell shape-determining protein MreB n=1 Tax=Candidatus Andersenbacteria bacterium RIFCSPHIGHO2_12_FULL_45_11 TaxID=1797281 RepID=A0A1G1X1I7_9BACT|nr:MAG: rod shape-determining protein [Candidatus Andersenbacteria bacterium RIFCSPHIGHO2_01_FULL_46_36]OGY33661.1 MAG: rod shape-determining protein [Candidatus Andersenbacteria bacterium RIFCSPHIGHO2_12_FULL_45_11]